MSLLNVFALIAAVAALGCFAAGVVTLRRRRLFGMGVSVMFGALLLTLSALLGTISIATRGYRALTREEVAATVDTRPTGPQRFQAVFVFPDGTRQTYDLAGDQLYVDAHILKWKPIANVLGLHTAFELDRVGGRYVALQDERDSTRTIHSLKADKPFDMFALRRRYTVLAPLLDTEYGSATFVAADEPARFEVRVSTTGLLMRTVEAVR